MSFAILVRLLLAMTMEIWDRECGPFRRNLAVFAILGQFGNIISPWGKGPSQEGMAIPVPYDEGSIFLEFRILADFADFARRRLPQTQFYSTKHGGTTITVKLPKFLID